MGSVSRPYRLLITDPGPRWHVGDYKTLTAARAEVESWDEVVGLIVANKPVKAVVITAREGLTRQTGTRREDAAPGDWQWTRE